MVAKEIRRLADQTAEATLNIERTTEEMFKKVQAGVNEMESFDHIVEQSTQDVKGLIAKTQDIIDHVENLTPRFEDAQQSMSSQSTGASQISSAVKALSIAARQTQASLDGLRTTIGKI